MQTDHSWWSAIACDGSVDTPEPFVATLLLIEVWWRQIDNGTGPVPRRNDSMPRFVAVVSWWPQRKLKKNVVGDSGLGTRLKNLVWQTDLGDGGTECREDVGCPRRAEEGPLRGRREVKSRCTGQTKGVVALGSRKKFLHWAAENRKELLCWAVENRKELLLWSAEKRKYLWRWEAEKSCCVGQSNSCCAYQPKREESYCTGQPNSCCV